MTNEELHEEKVDLLCRIAKLMEENSLLYSLIAFINGEDARRRAADIVERVVNGG